jgi:hypothetical protein
MHQVRKKKKGFQTLTTDQEDLPTAGQIPFHRPEWNTKRSHLLEKGLPVPRSDKTGNMELWVEAGNPN